MSGSKIYKCYVYLCGIQIPYIDFTINSSYGQFTSATVQLPYSPYIQHIFPFTKIQIFEQLNNNGKLEDSTLEFDGVVVAINRQKNVLGQVGVSLNCYTDGIIWARRKQFDFYLKEIANQDSRGTGDQRNIRADGYVTNFFSDLIGHNKYDVGVAASCVLTSSYSGNSADGISGQFYYNGKKFTDSSNQKASNANPQVETPTFYTRYLSNYKLQYKVYGISTSLQAQEFFQTNQFINLITKNLGDLKGENSFHNIAQQVLNYGFYQFFDIANPCFLKATTGTQGNIKVGDTVKLPVTTTNNTPDIIDAKVVSNNIKAISVNNKRDYNGLAEYVCKPISVLGVPLSCNIIWPDQILNENLNYDFLNAPTRVIAHRYPLPGDSNSQHIVLTTDVVAGPSYTNQGDFLRSLTPKITDYSTSNDKTDLLRNTGIFSDYENMYGINYHALDISYAFDSALIRSAQFKDVNRLNNYLNYEFAQKFFSSRKYSIQVTPDTNPVIGLPIVVLDTHGQHIIAFCSTISKYYSAIGQKVINLGISYPRYYYEDIGTLGSIVDPGSNDPVALKEMETIFGSKAICKLTVTKDSTYEVSSKDLIKSVEQLFDAWYKDSSDNKDNIKKDKARKGICTLNNFLSLNGISPVDNFPDGLPLYEKNYIAIVPSVGDQQGSSISENTISTNIFRVWDRDVTSNNYLSTPKAVQKFPKDSNGISNQSIIQYHLTWCKYDQRI